MSKKILILSVCAGIFAAVACFVYNMAFVFAFGVNFSKLVNAGSLAGFNIAGCLLAGFGYAFFTKKFPAKGEIIFSLLFALLSFGSIILPLSATLPLSIQNPELFPGLAIPMHFFPAMGWYTLKPIFIPARSAS